MVRAGGGAQGTRDSGWLSLLSGGGGSAQPSSAPARRWVASYAWARQRRLWLVLVLLACACMPLPWLLLYVVEHLQLG